jgi:heme exporter protein A
VGLRRRVTAAQVTGALETVGVPGLTDRLVRTLSAGQKRRVALAALTLFAAPLWLLDEPTTHLDAGGHRLVTQLIEQHVRAGGVAVAAVHHEISVSAQLVRRLELSAT